MCQGRGFVRTHCAEREGRDKKVERRRDDAAREQDEEVEKRKIRERIRKEDQDKAAGTILKCIEEKEQILKARVELEEKTGRDHQLDKKRKDMKKYANRLKKIKSIRKKEEKNLEEVQTRRSRDQRGRVGSGREFQEEQTDERRERKKRQKKAEVDAKEKKKRMKEEQEADAKQEEARRIAGNQKAWELRETLKKYEKEVKKHKEVKERSLKKMSKGMVLSPDLRRMHTMITEDAKRGISFNQMKMREAEDNLEWHERNRMAERRRKMQSSNADRDREEEEVMDLVGEIANGEARSEKRSVALEDGVEVVVVEEEMAGEEMETDEETDVRTVKLVGRENEEGESTPSKLSEMFEDSMRDWGSQEEALAQVFKADVGGNSNN